MTRGDCFIVAPILGGVKFHQVYQENKELAKAIALFLTRLSAINKETLEKRLLLEKEFYGDCREEVQEVRALVEEAGNPANRQRLPEINARLRILSDARSRLLAFNDAYADLLKEDAGAGIAFGMEDLMSCEAIVSGKTMDEIAALSVISRPDA